MPKDMPADAPATVVMVRRREVFDNIQRLDLFTGISDRTAGTRALSMYKVVMPPGGASEPHSHRDYETAIYILKGRIETRYGEGLKQSMKHEAGDFVFIPAGVLHQPVNLSQTETAEAIVARNDPSEQENVIPYDAE
ncbi:MAG: cupin domain-containing protein [Dongiaceae bacterium]